MNKQEQYKDLLTKALKTLVTYAKTDDVDSKTVMVQAVDKTDKLQSVSYMFGDIDVAASLIQHAIMSLPDEQLIMLLGGLVDDYKEVLRLMIESHDNGDLDDID